MRHCRSRGQGLCLERDTGAWITLRHAALEIKDWVTRKEFDNLRTRMPLTDMLNTATNKEVEWLLAAFGCVNYLEYQHRVQLLVEKGHNCNPDKDSIANGSRTPFPRAHAVIFCYGHSLFNQKYLEPWRLGSPMTRQMLVHFPGFLHYTDQLAADVILRDGLKAGAQLTRRGRSDVHATLFCPQDDRGDWVKRIHKVLETSEVAAVV